MEDLSSLKLSDQQIEDISNSMYGGSIASKAYMYAVNKYIDYVDPKHLRSRRLYDGEYHVPLHNFTGPGTRMDLKEVREHKPYNGIDACSKQHDLDYEEIKKGTYRGRQTSTKEEKSKAIMDADREAIECYNKHQNEYGYTAAKAGISGKLKLETLLSMLKGKPTTLYGGLIHEFSSEQLLKQRNPEFYTTAEKEIIRLLTVKRSKNAMVVPVGSFTFSIQKYPSDIDINESVIIRSVDGFVTDLKNMIRRIKKKKAKDIYFSDFKAGKTESGEGIHWTEKEILKGKTDQSNGGIDLVEALSQESVVKIDIIAVDSQRIIEASAFFVLYLGSIDNPVNVPINFFDVYVDGLKRDIEKYKEIKPFKAVKRLWSLMRLEKNTDVLRKLAPLIDSNVSLMSQISADLETIHLIVEKHGEDLNNQRLKAKFETIIDGFIKRLSTVDDIEDLPYDELAAKLEMLKDRIKRSKFIQPKKMISLVENIHDQLNEIIKKETNNYLSHVGLKL